MNDTDTAHYKLLNNREFGRTDTVFYHWYCKYRRQYRNRYFKISDIGSVIWYTDPRLVYTHVPLSPSSINWYRSKGNDAHSWEGNRRRTGHASQTSVVYPNTRSVAYGRELSTPPVLLYIKEYGTLSPNTSRPH